MPPSNHPCARITAIAHPALACASLAGMRTMTTGCALAPAQEQAAPEQASILFSGETITTVTIDNQNVEIPLAPAQDQQVFDLPQMYRVVYPSAVTDIALGAYHTCALLSNGRLECWGYGGDGRLDYAAYCAPGGIHISSSQSSSLGNVVCGEPGALYFRY